MIRFSEDVGHINCLNYCSILFFVSHNIFIRRHFIYDRNRDSKYDSIAVLCTIYNFSMIL